MANNWIYGVVLFAALVLFQILQPLVTAGKASAIAMSPASLDHVNRTAPSPNPFNTVRAPLEPPGRDPFSANTTALPQLVTAPVVQPTPLPQPMAPPMTLSFAGRVTEPNGDVKIFVQLDGKTFAIEPGLVLSNGYVVDSVTDQTVELSYPPLNSSARLELPSTPLQEIR